MRLPQSLEWRITLVYTALIFISLSLLSLLLLNLPRDRYLIILPAAIAALALLLPLLPVYFLARQASRSIRSVTEGSRRLVAGDLEYRTLVAGRGAIAELARAFNSIAVALRDRITDLSGDRDKLLAILATMADAVIVVGPGGVITLLNPAAEALLNVKDSDAVGRRFMEVSRDPDLHRLISRCFETGQQQHSELELLHLRRYLSGPPHSGSTAPLECF